MLPASIVRIMEGAIIIGAGPAGLFCAETLRRGGWSGDVLVVEQGKRFDDRFVAAKEWSFDPSEVLKGEGGAGFLADAKLCLSPDAGVQFDASLAAQYPRALSDIDFHIYQELLDQGHEIRRVLPNPAQLRATRSRLLASDLHLDAYAVRPLGSDMARAYLLGLVKRLRAIGVDLIYETKVEKVHHDRRSGQFRVLLRSRTGDYEKQASHVFFAIGAAQTSWLLQQDLGVSSEPNDVDIGVRLEFPAWGGDQLREAGDNPKIKFYDGYSYSKTHCFVHRGQVFFYYFDDMCLVDAHAVRERPTNASAVNILYKVPRSESLPKPAALLTGLGEAVRASDRLLPCRMSMSEFLQRGDLPSSGSDFVPTLKTATETNLKLLLPAQIYETIREHINRLSRYAPGLATKDAVVYGPAAQWVNPRVRLGPAFSMPNLKNAWCIGDGSGLTAGVLPAIVSGVVAARDAVARLRGEEDQLNLWSFP